MIHFKNPTDYNKLFLDMDCFFASVEQQINPPLRNQPVAIAPYVGSSGCVISASKKAKEFGVKTGIRVGEAKKLCPTIKILPSRPFLYHFYHKEIVSVLESFTPFLKILSIDEVSFLLDESKKNQKAIKKFSVKIKKTIKEKIGDYLTCSVGVGPNQFLAKVAAEAKKPNGLGVITIKELALFYKKLDLLDLPGINFRMQAALNLLDIKTSLDFFNAREDLLVRHFHKSGKNWYLRLRGFEVDDFKTKTSSVGHSYVLPPVLRNKEGAEKVVLKLAQKIGYRLRKNNFLAGALSLSIKFLNDGEYRKFVNIDPASDSQTLIKAVLRLFSQIQFYSLPICIYLTAFKLTRSKQQRPLFDQIQKKVMLSEAVDKINDKYGQNTIHFSQTDEKEEIAPNRIPFGKPRYEI